MQADEFSFHRRSIRLRGHDYASPGAYFVTMVTYQRKHLFGSIVDGVMYLSHFGQIVSTAWELLSERYAYVFPEPFIVMPNHFHGILHIVELDDICRGGSRPAPTDIQKIKPLGQLIGVFKTTSAKQINIVRSTPGHPVWHRNYYELIIRNQTDLDDITTYILTNPDQWLTDPEHTL